MSDRWKRNLHAWKIGLAPAVNEPYLYDAVVPIPIDEDGYFLVEIAWDQNICGYCFELIEACVDNQFYSIHAKLSQQELTRLSTVVKRHTYIGRPKNIALKDPASTIDHSRLPKSVRPRQIRLIN